MKKRKENENENENENEEKTHPERLVDSRHNIQKSNSARSPKTRGITDNQMVTYIHLTAEITLPALALRHTSSKLYATEGTFLISEYLSTDSGSALREDFVLIKTVEAT